MRKAPYSNTVLREGKDPPEKLVKYIIAQTELIAIEKYKTSYQKTLITIFQFCIIFQDIYERPPKNKSKIDDTIQDFLVQINKSINEDEENNKK